MNRLKAARNQYRATFIAIFVGGLAVVIATGILVAIGQFQWSVVLVALMVATLPLFLHYRLRFELALAEQQQAKANSLGENLHQAMMSTGMESQTSYRRDLEDILREIISLGSVLEAKAGPTRREWGDYSDELLRRSDELLRRLQGVIDDSKDRNLTDLEANRSLENSMIAIADQVIEEFRTMRVSVEQLPYITVEHLALREKLVAVDGDMLMLEGWAVTAPVVDILAQRILERDEPQTVVELGSGVSTLWTALALCEVQRGHCMSFDHRENFARATTEMIQSQGLDDFATVVLAPIGDVQVGSKPQKWYQIPELSSTLSIDILFIDGPPAVLQKEWRFPAVAHFYEYLSDGAWVIFDNTIRRDEKGTLNRWLAEYPELEVISDNDKATVLQRTGRPGKSQ